MSRSEDSSKESSMGRGRDESEIVTVKFPEKLLDEVDGSIVENDEYNSRNDFVVKALEEFSVEETDDNNFIYENEESERVTVQMP